eukprot:GFUD01009148.1.p1 GENE.GFUD01009148.1~~GFUD01009148.1.p1  ORF type:complete len:982 (+),score=337.04 GFUD01009148.1:78-2948(+)
MATTSLPLGQPESHQLIKRAEELSRMVSSRKDLYGDREAWTSHQELAALYRRLLVRDLEFSLDKKVEQELWNVCFKNYISHLQAKARDKRNPNRSDAQMTLSWFLENASGFYILLLEEVRQTFNLDIPFLQSGDPYGIWSHLPKPSQSTPTVKPAATSCHYVCQHCLVHLGDIARYRSQTRQAETFYRHAISLAPGSGQPYNQIAILEASRGNRLATVYFYVRAVCLRYPFPAATTNLSKMLGKLGGVEGGPEKERTAKVTQHTFIPLFLRMHGLLHHAQKLRQAVKMSLMLAESLTSLVVSESLSTWQLLQVTAVNMWAWEQVMPRTSQMVPEQLSKEERLVAGVVASCQAAILSATLLPVYTLKKGPQLLDYFAMPATRLLLEWVTSHPAVLKERGFTTRPQIWPGLARLLNEIQPLLLEFNPDQLTDYPLPEDYDLQAFSPLLSNLAKYNMKQVLRGAIQDQDKLALLRCARLIEVGRRLTKLSPQVLRFCSEQDSFVAVEAEWVEMGEDPEVLVEEIEMLEDIDSSEEDSDSPVPVWENLADTDKTKGILKTSDPSPSSPVSSPSPVTPRPKPPQRNVAMAAILKRAGLASANPSPDIEQSAGDNKKVMFKTPSPSNSQASTADSNSQFSASQEHDDVIPLLPNPPPPKGKSRRSWSPTPPPTALVRSKISVEQLDFSVPPPSLHSNVRPPALFSPPPQTRQPLSGIQPLRGNEVRDAFPGVEYSQGAPVMALERFPGSDLFPSRDMNSMNRDMNSMNRDMGNMVMSDNHWPRPEDQQRMEFPPNMGPGPLNMGPGPLGSMFPNSGRPQGPPSPTKNSPSHNPLLQLLSSVDRPSSLGPLGAGPVGPQSMFSRPGPGPSPYNSSWPSPQQASGPPHPDQQGAPTPQAYSLFSPSAWPGPLLSSPNISNSPGHSTNSSHSSPQRAAPTGGNMQMFGGGPSPLERLLHQARNEK